MITPPIIIAIDGYSSTGKSTFAKMIAARLGYLHIDTGALYRAITLFALENNLIDENNRIDEKSLSEKLSGVTLSFKTTGEGGKSEMYLNDRNVEKEIRSLSVSNKVSHIAVLPIVRNFVDLILHEMGKNKGVVMDGRDIGTAVFPNAELKIFMTADPLIRAKRRQMEMEAKGENADLEQIVKNLRERDYIDGHRETAPLTRAKDAILLDNSNMTIEQQLDWVLDIMRGMQMNHLK